MLKLLRCTRRYNRLCDSMQNVKNSVFSSNFTCKSSIINQPNYQQSFSYGSEALKQAKIDLPGLESDVNVDKITNNDPDLLKKLQIIILEVDIMRQEGQRVPDAKNIKEYHWSELLLKPSISQRKKYLNFLWKIEKKKENKKIKQEEAKIQRDNRPEYVDDGHIRYGLNNNTIFIRIYDSTINHLYNSKLINAQMFGQPLVIDVGYDRDMTTRECLNCAKQIMLAFSENRIHDEPFDLHLCNVDPNSPTIKALGRHIATLYEPGFPLTVHEESYHTAKFPSIDFERKQQQILSGNSEKPITSDKRKLIYLTPHCREEMREFDHDAIYIIGGIVDKINQEPLSLAKAKKEGIKMQKFPLDRYLCWGSGSGKSLTLNHVVSILLDVRRTGSWEYALRHVPKRKILQSNTLSNNADQRALRFDKNRSYNHKKSYKISVDTRDIIHKLLDK